MKIILNKKKLRLVSFLVALIMVVHSVPIPVRADVERSIVCQFCEAEIGENEHFYCGICEICECENEHSSSTQNSTATPSKPDKICTVCHDEVCDGQHLICNMCGALKCEEEHVVCEACGKVDCSNDHQYCEKCEKYDCGEIHIILNDEICDECGKEDCICDLVEASPSEPDKVCEYCGDVNCVIEHKTCSVCGTLDCEEKHEEVSKHPMFEKLVKTTEFYYANAYRDINNLSDGKIVAYTFYPNVLMVTDVAVIGEKTYYQLSAAKGCEWPGIDPELTDGFWLEDSRLVLFEGKPCEVCENFECDSSHENWCKICKKDNCGVTHTANQSTVLSQGTVSEVKATGTMSEDTVLTVNSADVSISTKVSENMIDLVGDATTAVYKGYTFDIDLSGKFEGDITITIPESQIPVMEENEQIRIVHLLDSEEAVLAAKEQGTAVAYSEDGLGEAFPEEVEASGEVDTLYYEELNAERDEDGNVVFTTSSFSMFSAYTITVQYGTEQTVVSGEQRIMLSTLLRDARISEATINSVLAALKNVGSSEGIYFERDSQWDIYQITYCDIKNDVDSGHGVGAWGGDRSLTFQRPIVESRKMTISIAGINIQITLSPTNSSYKVRFNANGGSGTMSDQDFQYGEIKNLNKNVYAAPAPQYKIMYNVNVGAGKPISGNAPEDQYLYYQFNGWEDPNPSYYRNRDTGDLTTIPYSELDVPFYAKEDHPDSIHYHILKYYPYTMGIYNKYGITLHYMDGGGKNNTYIPKKPRSGELPGAYPDEALVSNLTVVNDETVNLYAQWVFQTVTLPVLQRIGYEHTGWWHGTNFVGVPGGLFTPHHSTSADYTFTASWSPINYTITYNTNGGSTIPAHNYIIEDAVTLAESPTKNGYEFAGWKLENTTGTNWSAGTYAAVEAFNAGQYGNITLVAQWKPIVTVIFNETHFTATGLDGYSGSDGVWTKAVETGSIVNYVFTPRTGFKIKNVMQDNNTLGTDSSGVIKNKVIDRPTSFEIIAEPIGYTITFDSNGGSQISSQQYTIIETVNLPNQPERPGYSFGGWKVTNTSGSNWEPDITYAANHSFVSGLYGDITLTAQWSIKSYDLIIQTSNSVDSNQSFIYDVTGDTKDGAKISLTVVLGANDSQKIAGLPAGNYTITEKNRWSWRFGVQKRTVLLEDAAPDVQIFTYSSILSKVWLNGYGNQMIEFFNPKTSN